MAIVRVNLSIITKTKLFIAKKQSEIYRVNDGEKNVKLKRKKNFTEDGD